MRWMKKHWSTAILVMILAAGLILLSYPTVSDYWNSFHQSRAIASYAEAVAEIDENQYEKIWEDARQYNAQMPDEKKRWSLTDDQRQDYERQLNIGGTGVMGYIEIPSIQVSLPIYHGTSEGVLQIAVGHIEGSSLPVGGMGTHCVLSGHRGLPSARLFTDLNKMEEGDRFLLRVLDETLTYEVDQIHIVEPNDLHYLEIEKGQDLCTLVTCTPYGINSHRLLVRGHRVANDEDDSASDIRITADAIQIDPLLAAPVLALPMLLIGLILLLTGNKQNPNSNRNPNRNSNPNPGRHGKGETPG